MSDRESKMCINYNYSTRGESLPNILHNFPENPFVVMKIPGKSFCSNGGMIVFLRGAVFCNILYRMTHFTP